MIKNKLKLGLFALALLLTLGVAGQANAAALTWTADQRVDFSSPDIDLTILSGSEATSLVVGVGSIAVVIPNGDVFTVVTDNNRELTVTGNTTATVSNVCDDVSTVILTGGAGGETITITPTGGACGNGGGGGGGGGSRRNNNAATPAVPANDGGAPADCLPGYQFSPSTGRNCNAATPAVVCAPGHMFSPTTGQACGSFTPPGLAIAQAAGGNAYAFGLGLVKQGVRGEACRAWQMFFNAKRNAGLATDGMCGPLTMSAARAWQSASGLVSDGLLGPASRARAMMQ